MTIVIIFPFSLAILLLIIYLIIILFVCLLYAHKTACAYLICSFILSGSWIVLLANVLLSK